MISDVIYQALEEPRSTKRLIDELRGTPLQISEQLIDELQFIPFRYHKSLISEEIMENMKAMKMNKTDIDQFIQQIRQDMKLSTSGYE